MKDIEKSKSIRDGLRKGFQDGTSKMVQRRCYGYDAGPDGELVINPDEAAVVCWIFARYLDGDSLGKIVAGLEEQGVRSPAGIGGSKIKNDGFMDRYLYSDTHEDIISDVVFNATQEEKFKRTKYPENTIAMNLRFQ